MRPRQQDTTSRNAHHRPTPPPNTPPAGCWTPRRLPLQPTNINTDNHPTHTIHPTHPTPSRPNTHLQDAGHLAAAVQHDEDRAGDGAQAEGVGHEQPDAGAAVHALVIGIITQQLVAATRAGRRALVKQYPVLLVGIVGARQLLAAGRTGRQTMFKALAAGTATCTRPPGQLPPSRKKACPGSAHRRTELIMMSARVAMIPGKYCSQEVGKHRPKKVGAPAAAVMVNPAEEISRSSCQAALRCLLSSPPPLPDQTTSRKALDAAACLGEGDVRGGDGHRVHKEPPPVETIQVVC